MKEAEGMRKRSARTRGTGPRVAVGQLHDDEELPVDDVEAFERRI